MIIFIDFEASSLHPGSWPLEVGWSSDGGETESHLICPAPGWVDWDAAAEAVHGISLQHLREHGSPLHMVADRMVRAVASPGTIVASDAAGWDQLWLDRLLGEAGRPDMIEVHPARRIYQTELRRLLELAPSPQTRWHDHVVRGLNSDAAEMLDDVHAAEIQRSRTRHRAGPDSSGMLWILHEIRARVSARLVVAEATLGECSPQRGPRRGDTS